MGIALKILAILAVLAGVHFAWGLDAIFEALKNFAQERVSGGEYVGVMGIACALGFPLSLCYLFAGMAFPIWKAWISCMVVLALSSTIGFFIGKFFASDKFICRISQKIEGGDTGKIRAFRLNFYVRAIPGIPYWVQNVFLGAVCSNFKMYFIVNMAVQGAISLAMVSVGFSFSSADMSGYLAAAVLILFLVAVHWAFLQFYTKPSWNKKAKAIAAYSAYAGMNVAFMAVASLISMLFFAFGSFRRRLVSALLSAFAKWFSTVFLPELGAYKLEVSGLENLRTSATVFVANHISRIDPLLILSYAPGAGVVLKRKYSTLLAIWFMVKFYNFISIDMAAGNEAARALDRAKGILSNGGNLIIFPEGRRSRNGRVLEFKKLAFKLAKETGSYVVPIALWSEKPFLEGGGADIPEGGGRFCMRFLAPVDPSDFKSASSLSDFVYGKILEAVSEMGKQ